MVDRKKLFTWMYVFMIICVIVTCIVVVWFLTTNGSDCIKDPLEYFMRETGNKCFCAEGLLE